MLVLPKARLARSLLVLVLVSAYVLVTLLSLSPTQQRLAASELAGFDAESDVLQAGSADPATSGNASALATERKLTISIWKVGERMKRRFLRSFGSSQRDPFEHCSVKNCRLETDDTKVESSNAVMFHLHLMKDIRKNLPPVRPIDQVWIFFTDESPYHTFMADPSTRIKDINGLFNMSMTYRSDSDIVVPYGRSEKLDTPNVKDFSADVLAKTKGITILGSNCGGINRRWNYVRELQKHIQVDVFGKCGKPVCPGHFTRDCDIIKDYQFYLAFENSNCAEYMTEKLWYNGYFKMAIPIVMGASKDDYTRLCPPKSFIHVEDFASPKDLAQYIRKLQANPDQLLEYHAWRRDYRVLNEHGYFGSPSLHLCRMCEALQRPHNRTTLYHLEDWWSVNRDCRKPVF